MKSIRGLQIAVGRAVAHTVDKKYRAGVSLVTWEDGTKVTVYAWGADVGAGSSEVPLALLRKADSVMRRDGWIRSDAHACTAHSGTQAHNDYKRPCIGQAEGGAK